MIEQIVPAGFKYIDRSNNINYGQYDAYNHFNLQPQRRLT